MKAPVRFIDETDERKLAIIKAVAAGEAFIFCVDDGGLDGWRNAEINNHGHPGVFLGAGYALNEAEAYPPTPDIIKWEYIHDNYEWVARVADGVWFAYVEEPFVGKVCWESRDGSRCYPLSAAVVTSGTCDWKDSLQRRPE